MQFYIITMLTNNIVLIQLTFGWFIVCVHPLHVYVGVRKSLFVVRQIGSKSIS